MVAVGKWKLPVDEQIPLDGLTQQRAADLPGPGLLRRESDRAAVCNYALEKSGRRAHTVNADGGALPVTIFTLGRFSLLINGQAIDFGREVPKRPLELLKATIAQGGRDISISSLTALLWPDVDGDKASRSFATNLHRLRKILGDDRILVLKEGKLSLDARYCWVDVWTFERLLGATRRVLGTATGSHQACLMEGLTKNLLTLYQDHFLVREEMTSWSVSMRERLRSKYIHSLGEVGRFWETHGFWEQAIDCYQKGVDVDDLVEMFYQRLMVCYQQTSRYSEGMSVYRRCRQTLSIALGLQPEPETESLYLALRNARPGKQTA